MSTAPVRLLSRFDEHRIERALGPLIGKRVRGVDRQGFTFGDDRTVPVRFPRPGGPAARVVAEYALNIQCSWQIAGVEKIREWLAAATYVVERVRGDNNGGVRLELSGQFALTVTPGESGEQWRLFRPGTNERHFVVSSDGIYLD